MDYLRHKFEMQNIHWYIDRLVEYRECRQWDRVRELYDEIKQLDLDFQIPMEKRDGNAIIYKQMDIPEAICRIIGADEIMLDMWPELGEVVCEGADGWHRKNTYITGMGSEG